MSTVTDLVQFRDFLNSQLAQAHATLSPEEALDLWRLEHPHPDELSASVADLKVSLAEIDSGEALHDARNISAEIRRKLGLPTAT